VRLVASRRGSIGALLSVLALLGGCGDDETADKRPGLAKAIYPRCGVDSFEPTRARPHPREKGAWVLTYAIKRNPDRPPPPGATTGATIYESPPTGGRPKLGNGRDVTIAGRRVSLVDRTAQTSYVASWNTKTANYTVIADGSSPRAIGELVRCLP
jgi:hypothetical protein